MSKTNQTAPAIVKTSITFDAEYAEYTVRAFVAGPRGCVRRYPEADYFTNDKQDARDTARAMVRGTVDAPAAVREHAAGHASSTGAARGGSLRASLQLAQELAAPLACCDYCEAGAR